MPTEAEWEYAARGGTVTDYYCGDDQDCLDEIAWYRGNSDKRVHPVRGKMANAYNLYDMLGNVWEWTADCYDEGYYGYSPLANPKGPEGSGIRVKRGGDFEGDGRFIAVTYRDGYHAPSFAMDDVGFRCARPLSD